MRLLIVVLTFALLAGCASSGGHYGQYLATHERIIAAQANGAAAFSDIAAACQDARCVENVAAMAAITQANRQTPQIAPPPREPGFIEQAANVLTAATPALSVLAGVHQSRYSRDQTNRQWQAIEGIASAPWAALPSIIEPLSGPGTVITVGGDYVSGTQHHGDYTGGDRWEVGRDFVGRDRIGRDQIGGDQYRGPVAGRDIIGGDRTDNRGGRIGSPGPFEEQPVVIVPPVIFPPDPPEGGTDACAPIPTWNGTRIVFVTPNISGC